MATSLVPGEDKLAPRVVPKLFPDVPSAEERQKEKRQTGWLWAIIIALAAIVIAFGALLAIRLTQPPPEAAKLKDAQHQIDVLTDENQRLSDNQTNYAGLINLDDQIKQVKDRISDALNDPARSGARQAIHDPKGWQAFAQDYDWKTEAAGNVGRYLADLNRLAGEISQMPGTHPGSGGVTTCSNPDCTPVQTPAHP